MRTARAVVFATMCVAISAAGHVWMSGRPVPPWALILAMLLVFAAALAAAGRRRGFAAIAALMLTGEFGLHLLFSAAQRTADAGMAIEPGPATAGSGAGAMSMPMLGMPGMPGMSGMPANPPLPGSWLMSLAMSHGPLGMIAVHAAAGLLCAWWLYRGEQAVFGLLWILALKVPVLTLFDDPEPVVVPVLPRRPSIPRLAPVAAWCEPLDYVLVRRGPPRCPIDL